MEKLRVSAAALARIEIDGKIVLGLNKNRMKKGKEVYMPFGGAIEFKEEARSFLNSLQVQYEKGNDLRFLIEEKYIPDFDHWFRSGANREKDVYRELREELVLEEKLLPSLERDLVKIENRGLLTPREATDRVGQEGQITQRYLEIFNVQLPAEYEATLRDATQDKLVWVTEDEIREGETKDHKEIRGLPLLI
jgi:hypothetical protein